MRSTTEGIRQETEDKSLPKLTVPGTDIKVKPDGYPTLTGKGRVSKFVVENISNNSHIE